MLERNEQANKKTDNEQFITLQDRRGRTHPIPKKLWVQYWKSQNPNGEFKIDPWNIPFFEDLNLFLRESAKPFIIDEIIQVMKMLNIETKTNLHQTLKATLIDKEVSFQFPSDITIKQVREIAEKSWELFQVDYEVIKKTGRLLGKPEIYWHLKADMTTVFNKFYIEPQEESTNSLSLNG